MEFDDLQKIWDTQNSQPIYAINEPALHKRILAKQQQGYRITHASEWLSMIVYGFTACFLLFMNYRKENSNLFIYVLAIWMLGSAMYVLVSRMRRIYAGQRFDRSLHGDLRHAIAVASYQVGLSRLLRWNMLPMGLLVLLTVWEGNKSVWAILGILIFWALTWYASGWEHGIYEKKKQVLENLQQKLENNVPVV